MDNVSNNLDSLARFQALREQAVRRQNKDVAKVESPRFKLQEAIEQKKMQGLAQNKTVADLAVKKPEPAISGIINTTFKKANELLLYDHKVKTSTNNSGSKILGNYVDMVG